MFGDKKGIEQRDTLIAYKNTFGSAMGKKVVMDLCNRFHILNAHDGDPFAEGQRAVVLHILKQCHFKIEDFDRLLKGDLE